MMKSFIFLMLCLLVGLVACKEAGNTTENNNDGLISTENIQNPLTADGEIDESTLPKFKFETLNYDFGAVIAGEKVSYTFEFVNIGGSDLIVSNVKKSCGCTVPRWSKEPIHSGGKGEIEIEFDSSGKKGPQYKHVTVYANTQPSSFELGFSADVVEPGK